MAEKHFLHGVNLLEFAEELEERVEEGEMYRPGNR